MSEDRELDGVLDVLSDEYARSILAEASTEPMSAKTLSDRCDASLPTVYRRIERLKEHDLVEERTRVKPDGGHHKVYTATLASVSIELDDGEYETSVERTDRTASLDADDAADRLTYMWENL
ncbi:ArsR/SmtB family transcription factor [Halostella litorea]|uniref:ArsR/SmtB family transcription factor n=1 Tax=Halostella litorea TaxID=2528831 RepID=UPI001092782C|nr:helix-turn-helix domain-containing protein [Halostella litorea]